MSTPTKLNGKQIKDGTINLIALFSTLGLGALDDGKALVYTHTPTPTVNFQKVKFTKINGIPNTLTAGMALVVNATLDGVDLVPIVKTFNGAPGDIVFNNTDQMTEGAINKYFNGKTTDQLPQGTTNLYFNGKTTTDLPEGTNLYWTNGRFDTRFAFAIAATNIQDLANVDLTGISNGDILKYNLALTKFEKLTLEASVVALNPTIDDGSGTPLADVQSLLSVITTRSLMTNYVLTLTGDTAIIPDPGMYIIQNDADLADSVIMTVSDATQASNLTSLIGSSIFNFTNTPANGKINLYSEDTDPGAPVVWRIKIDNQTAGSASVTVRKLM